MAGLFVLLSLLQVHIVFGDIGLTDINLVDFERKLDMSGLKVLDGMFNSQGIGSQRSDRYSKYFYT